jgi:hypothetical protein
MNVSGVSVKEVVETIESRIPYGRPVISILIVLLVLTVATASGIYLYHALLLPLVLGVASMVQTGKIVASTAGGVIGSSIGSIVLYYTFHHMSKTVLTDYKKVNDGLGEALEAQRAIGRRLDAIETRVSALEH